MGASDRGVLQMEVARYRCMEEALDSCKQEPILVCSVGNVLDPLSSRTRALLEPGLTVREYVCATWPMLSPGLEINVAIDGQYIGNDASALDRVVRPGQSLVLAVAPKGGGSDGGKSIFAAVAMLVLAVTAPMVGNFVAGSIFGLAAPVAGTAFSMYGLVSGLAAGAYMLGARLLVSAFVGTGATSSVSASQVRKSLLAGVMRQTPLLRVVHGRLSTGSSYYTSYAFLE
jgi:hypothetical protein